MKVSVDDVMGLIEATGILDADISSLQPNESFTEQGLDSLDVMTIFLEAEDKYAIKIPDEDYAKLRSVEQLTAYLDERQVTS